MFHPKFPFGYLTSIGRAIPPSGGSRHPGGSRRRASPVNHPGPPAVSRPAGGVFRMPTRKPMTEFTTTPPAAPAPKSSDWTGMGRSTIWRRAGEGTFPKPVKLGPRTTAWVAAEVESWGRFCCERQGSLAGYSKGATLGGSCQSSSPRILRKSTTCRDYLGAPIPPDFPSGISALGRTRPSAGFLLGDADTRGTACFGKVAGSSKIRAALDGLARPSRACRDLRPQLKPALSAADRTAALAASEFAAMLECPGA